jgi:hypothetical protein
VGCLDRKREIRACCIVIDPPAMESFNIFQHGHNCNLLENDKDPDLVQEEVWVPDAEEA